MLSVIVRVETDTTSVSLKWSSAVGGVDVQKEFGWSVEDGNSAR